MRARTVIVGAGIFGVTAALALRRRGHEVTLIDPGPLPHPLAESTDLSKVIRLDYGADAFYTALMERALDGWRRWNEDWGEPLFHESGVLFLCREEMAKGGFEFESHRLLTARGHAVERLDGAAIARRFPAWNARAFVDGYYNPVGGWAESGRVVSRLIDAAKGAGVRVLDGARVVGLVEQRGRVSGVCADTGQIVNAESVVVVAGAWTARLVPSLLDCFRAVGQPVFHLRPAEPNAFAAERFPVFGADIARTGYYGFPLHPQGVVKIANHGVGRVVEPSSEKDRRVTPEEVARLREFLAETFPALADAEVVKTRICVYCDTWDEHFWITRDPDRAGLTIAAGGSGHAFKFAPVIGDLIADAVEERLSPELSRFAHRPDTRPPRGEEAARRHDEEFFERAGDSAS